MVFKERNELNVEDASQLALREESEGANAPFFMTTGYHPFPKSIELSKEAKTPLTNAVVRSTL